MSNATIDQLTRINSVYVQTIREQDARIASLEQQLAAANEREREARKRSGMQAEHVYNLEYAIYQIGRRLRDYELDEEGYDQESIAKELIFLSTYCDNCKGEGCEGTAPDANGEGGEIYDCETCKGTGRNAAALAAASEKGGES